MNLFLHSVLQLVALFRHVIGIEIIISTLAWSSVERGLGGAQFKISMIVNNKSNF